MAPINNDTKTRSWSPARDDQDRTKTQSAGNSKTSTPLQPSTPADHGGGTGSDTGTTSAPVRTANAATARDGRAIRLADQSALQLRNRVDGALPTADGDAPGGPTRRRGVVEGTGPASSTQTIANRRNYTIDEGAQVNAKNLSNPPPSSSTAAPAEGWNRQPDGTYTFNGGSGDDSYTVRQDATGNMIVTNDGSGQEYRLSAANARGGATIDTGAGNDNVTIENSVRTPLTVNGGNGNDRVTTKSGTNAPLTLRGGAGNDVLIGGDGDDDLDGGAGDDSMFAGKGMDSLNGGAGNDYMFGDEGDDQLHGQDGDDHVIGGAGHDFIMGNAGADRLDGGFGSDAIYADKDDKSIDAGGREVPLNIPGFEHETQSQPDNDLDLIVSENGAPEALNMNGADKQVRYDKAATDAWLTAHPEFRFAGSKEAQERAKADIGVMLGTTEGRGLLNELSGALKSKKETLTIGEKTEGPGGTYTWGTNTATAGNWAGQYGDGTNRHPLPALYHELVHGYQDLVSGIPQGQSTFGGGRAINNLERQAVGLPWMDASGNVHGPNDLKYTDNLFRAALGLPTRSTYGGELGAPTGYAPDDGSGHDEHSHAA